MHKVSPKTGEWTGDLGVCLHVNNILASFPP
jgi:hypothetical protein